MKRSTILIGLTATALVLPLGAMTAAATEVAPAGATAWTEWISDDGGSAGREQPAISADGSTGAWAQYGSGSTGGQQVYIK